MLKGLGNLASLMKNAQEVQGRMQEAMSNLRAEGTAGGGMVKAEVNGHMKVLSIRIDPDLNGEDDREMLEDLVTAAVNNALDKARAAAAEEMSKGFGDIPGLGDAISKFGGLGGAGS